MAGAGLKGCSQAHEAGDAKSEMGGMSLPPSVSSL